MTEIQAPIGEHQEFIVRLGGRSYEAWFTFESIGRIESMARRHFGFAATIFELIARPSPTNLALLLIEPLNHEGQMGWGGEHKKPTVQRMLKLLQPLANEGRFLEVWRDCVKAVDANFAEPKEKDASPGEAQPTRE